MSFAYISFVDQFKRKIFYELSPCRKTARRAWSNGCSRLVTDSIRSLSSPPHVDQNKSVHIEQIFDRLLQNQIVIPQPAEVRDYLHRFQDLIDLLPRIGARTRERLGTAPQLSLEVYRDPEIEDAYLTLLVRQENYVLDLLDTLDNISAEFDAELAKKSGWILVTTDFDLPR